MKVFYLDAALRDDVGHHAPSARALVSAFKKRGHDVVVHGMTTVSPALKHELGVIPTFRVRTYDRVDNDPVTWPLSSFELQAHATLEDLRTVTGYTRDDLVYYSSAQPAQFMAVTAWFHEIPEERRPRVVLEFGTDPGLDVVGQSIRLREFYTDPRPLFYRHTGRSFKPDPRFVLVTFEKTSSTVYEWLTQHPVRTFPVPRFSDATWFDRRQQEWLTVSFLGHQRWDKGYHQVPAIIRRLLAEDDDVTVYVHNACPGELPDVQAEVRKLKGFRVTVDERAAGPKRWQELLDHSDVIVCPYVASRFVASYSAVACEAVANGIPLVVPADTSLSRLVEGYGAGATFGDVVDAIHRVIEGFDGMIEQARRGAERWRRDMGADKTVEAIMRLT